MRMDIDADRRDGRDPDNDPPFSRIFIVCGKTVNESELSDAFAEFGTIESCKIIKDKSTGESKGVAYIKYDKSSSAAKAIENMHGVKLNDEQIPLKVIIAEAKGPARQAVPESNDPEDLPPRSRLFLIIPKGHTEQELAEKLQIFPDLEFVKIVKDKNVAYAKFHKSSSAALAMEELNAQGQIDGIRVRALVADPKNKNRVDHNEFRPAGGPGTDRIVSRGFPERGGLVDRDRFDRNDRRRREDDFNMESRSPPVFASASAPILQRGAVAGTYGPQLSYADLALALQQQQQQQLQQQQFSQALQMPLPAQLPVQLPRQRLFVVLHRSVTQEALSRLFSKIPGMEYCDLKKDKRTDQSKGFAYINYSTPNAAVMAKEYFDGYEYPPGHRFKVMFAEPLGVDKLFGDGGMPMKSQDLTSLSAVRDSFAQMMSYTPGVLGYGTPTPSQTASPPGRSSDALRLSGRSREVYNPGVAGTASPGTVSSDSDSRLFIVLSRPVSENLLFEVFSRFGPLEYVRLQRDKNYGYVKYMHASAAQAAIQYLNGSEVAGQKMKVILADPPTSKDSRKRQRSDE